MYSVRSGETAAAPFRNGVIAIGNFDGVHRGHRAVLAGAKAIAMKGETARPLGVLTFEPHPRTVFRPDAPMFRLTPEPVKRAVLDVLGVDLAAILTFDKAFASQEAEHFVEAVLIESLGAAHVVVGYDFAFGKGRRGNPDLLHEIGAARGFGVTVVEAHTDEGGDAVSSSTIRAALAHGDLGLANEQLGYRWFVAAEIIHGEKRGRDLGYPTANMRLGADCRLKHGIYAVRMRVDGTVRNGVASYGRRPQFDNGAPLLETFVFDFAGDLYGKTAEVEFVAYLRPELTFEGADWRAQLIAQMDRDSEDARAALAALADPRFGPDGLAGTL